MERSRSPGLTVHGVSPIQRRINKDMRVLLADSTNDRIVHLLEKDPRASAKSIAKAVGVSETTVASRIRSLIDDGIIRIVLQQDTHATSNSAVAALVEFYLADSRALDEACYAVAAFEEVFSAYLTADKPHIIANLRAPTPKALNATLLRMAKNVPHLREMRTIPILDLGHYSTTIGLLKAPSPSPVSTDVGKRLVELLQADGRQSTSALSRQLGLSITAVRSRMKTLLNKPGVKISLVCDAIEMGYTCWYDVRAQVEPAHLLTAIARYSDHPAVRVVAHIAGEYNVELFLVTKSMEDVENFIKNDIVSTTGIIKFSIIEVTGVVKYDYNYNI